MTEIVVISLIIAYVPMVGLTAYLLGYTEGRGWCEFNDTEVLVMSMTWPLLAIFLPMVGLGWLVNRVYLKGRSQ